MCSASGRATSGLLLQLATKTKRGERYCFPTSTDLGQDRAGTKRGAAARSHEVATCCRHGRQPMGNDSRHPAKSRRDGKRLLIYVSYRPFGAWQSQVLRSRARGQGHTMSPRWDLRRIINGNLNDMSLARSVSVGCRRRKRGSIGPLISSPMKAKPRTASQPFPPAKGKPAKRRHRRLRTQADHHPLPALVPTEPTTGPDLSS